MQVELSNSFIKEFDKLKNNILKKQIKEAIQTVIDATKIQDIPSIKKLKGFSTAYRIRIGDFRIGIIYQEATICFVIFEHRKDIYKKFP